MKTDTETDWVTYTLDEADRLAERHRARGRLPGAARL
jgi:hypothetical protein